VHHTPWGKEILANLKKWVEDEPDTNYTHRVVKDDGTVADVGLRVERRQEARRARRETFSWC
jgi:hypothetical protein